MRGKCLVAVLLTLLVVFSVPMWGQEITANIIGTVKDPSGAVISGATVTITNTDKGIVVRTLKTDESGAFSAPLLPIGQYSVSAEAAGFKKVIEQSIVLNVNDKRTVTLTLPVGGGGEVVSVEADAMQVESQSATAAGLVSGTQVRELSLNNRNYAQLLTLVPGVASTASDQLYVGATNPLGTNTVNFSINGGRTSSNNWMVDGADNVDRGSNLTLLSFPSVDAIAEFKVLRGQYNAEFGRASGGQINVVTRSGTKTLHGSAYEFFRNDVLNANSYFNKNYADPSKYMKRPALRYNNFGWTLGGPIPIPGRSNPDRNQTFFFFSQEFRRVITYTNPVATVPTADERAGRFAHPVCIAWTGTSCAQTGTQIDASAINPTAKAYLDAIWSKVALPNDPVDAHTLRGSYVSKNNFREEMLKIDHVFGPRLTVSGKFLRDTIPSEEPGGLFTGSVLPGVSTTKTDSPGHNYTVRATATLTPTLLLETGYGYSYGAIKSEVTGLVSTKLSPNMTPTIDLPFESTLGRIPSITMTGLSGIAGYGPYDNYGKNHSTFANLTKASGKHTLKAGFTYYRYQKTENAAGNNVGSFTFAASGKPSGVGTLDLEQSWANFLTGHVSTFRQDALDVMPDVRTHQIEFYGQDEFRLLPNLTLSYGVRYSMFRQPIDAGNMLTNFDPTAYDPKKAPCITAAGLVDATCNPNYDPLNGIVMGGKNSPWGDKVGPEDNNAIAPRIGIAWDPFSDGKTSIRAGYGMFYDAGLFGTVEQNIFWNPPYVNVVDIPNTSFSDPGSGTPTISASPKRLYSRVPADYQTPYTQQWSLDFQRDLGGGFLFDIGYYGSKGTHLLGVVDINQPKPGAYVGVVPNCSATVTANCIPVADNGFITTTTTPLINGLRPYKGYLGIDAVRTWFNSNYNSMQVQLQKKFSGSSLVNVAYTWSHALTDNQTDRSTAPQNAYDVAGDYGPTQQDRRHIFTTNFVYELPFLRAQNGAAGRILGGWQFSGIVTAQSGVPLTVASPTGTADPSGQGCRGPSPCAVRPDMLRDPNLEERTVLRWFDTSAFAVVPAGQFRNGNERRGTVIGPGLWRVDMSLFKNIKITERVKSQFRFEMFNAFNHANFDSVQVNMNNSKFGQVTSTRDPRIIQLALKVSF